VANHLPIYFANMSEALPHAASGTIRLLAVSSRQRVPQVPDVPTVAESGYPGFETLTWNGLMAPAGTPKDVIDKLAREIALGVKDPKVIERLTEYGVDPLGSSPEEFAKMIAADIALWSEAVKVADDKIR
jgi:tripartite-type tricarboxylate transporter receptor subunit TctC